MKLSAAFEMVRLLEVKNENPSTKTFVFEHDLGAKPGQFVMAWIPTVNEKPMSVGGDEGNTFSLTVANVGTFSEAFQKLKPGDRIGVRGPYGRAYQLKGKRVAMVGGGFGSAPLRFLAELARKKAVHVDFIQGARSKDRLILEKDIQKLGCHLHVATNDGSKGKKGMVTDVLAELLKANRYDGVYACGPELMMQAVGKLCEKHATYCEISVERYMKCGFGVCGQCDCGGLLTCVEGTVVDYQKIKDNPDFGRIHRDASGQKHFFK
ncbi:dihydroorotate dehydrogenase electron transfer subunit [Candidatus Micrarchaeota archaeon]|nr:dihydroorotate dehydrogenase electron transfer subunit [Candidatus Micrarchaeota archaeon]